MCKNLFAVSENLYNLYTYFLKRLIDSNIKKDNSILEEVLHFVEELRDSHYPIEENHNGTVIYTDGLYYLSNEIYSLNNINPNLKYLIYFGYMVEILLSKHF